MGMWFTRGLLVSALIVGLAATSTAHAAFPGANGKIYFTRAHDDQSDIWSMNPDGTQRENLTATPDVNESSPAASADGERIAFVAYTDPGWALFTIDRDGTNRTRLTGSEYSPLSPTWSPDGRKIAFSNQCCYGYNLYDIYVISIDGSAVSNITQSSPPVLNLEPSWSADGTKIVYRSNEADERVRYDVWTIAPDSGEKTRLTYFSPPGRSFGPSVFDPSWSPDGAKIAFSSNKDYFFYFGEDPRCTGAATCIFGSEDVMAMDADGSNLTNLTRTASPQDLGPAWSPDGAKVAFWSGDSFRRQIHVMDSGGGDDTIISPDSALDYEPDWAPLANRPPDCSGVTATPGALLSPDGRFRRVALSGAGDPDADSVTTTVTGVTQDEPVRGARDLTSPDAVIGATAAEVRLRAERDPKGDGRVYRIAFEVSEGRSGTCSGEVSVSVPRKKKEPAIDSAPPSYDSFTS
jgi:Tol biopolymer transport system component